MALSLENKSGIEPNGPYLRYSASIEQPAAGEHIIFDELSRTMQHITRTMASRYSDERQRFVDEHVSFTPWHAMTAHRPLGGIMRSRLKSYEEASKYRLQRNGREQVEPTSIEQVPA